MLLKLIGDLEAEKKSLQTELQGSNTQNKIIELQLSKLQQEQNQNQQETAAKLKEKYRRKMEMFKNQCERSLNEQINNIKA